MKLARRLLGFGARGAAAVRTNLSTLGLCAIAAAWFGACHGSGEGDSSQSGGKDGGVGIGGGGWVDGAGVGGTGGGGAGTAGDSGTSLDYDVAVVGAGPGGIAAAIAAARMGAHVVLIEESDWVGGQMTAAAVANMDGGAAPPTRSGLYAEFQSKVAAYYQDATRFPPSGKSIGTCYWSSATTCFEPSVGRKLLETMLSEAGVDVLTQRRVESVNTTGGVVTGLDLLGGQAISARVVIDATETGDVIALSGARYRVGNSVSDSINPDACIQSMTYVAVVKKYPGGLPPELAIQSPPPEYSSFYPQFASIVTTNGSTNLQNYPVSVPFHAAYRGLPDSSNPNDYDGTEYALITKTGINWANDYPGYTMAGGTGIWAGKLKVAFLENQNERRNLTCQAKLSTLGFIYYLQHDLGQADWSVANDEGYDSTYNQSQHCPEIPDALVAVERHMPPMPYVRESRRIVSVTTLTAKDMAKTDGIATKNFSSSIAVGDYGTDLHNCHDDADFESSLGETSADQAAGGRFQVPLETLVPESVDGLLAAEKNIGVSRLAAGAIRLQPITMLTGEAAGVLAALANQQKSAPRKVRTVEVQKALLEKAHALSRFWYDDVPITHASWKGVQLASTYAIMNGTSASHFDVDASLTRRQAAVVIDRLFNLDTSNPPATPTFGDVPTTDPAYAYIEAFAKAGFTAGCSTQPKLFCPDADTHRGELAVFLAKGLGLDPESAPTTPLFDDIAGSPYFKYIQVTAQAGIFAGCTSQKFCPTDPVSRGTTAMTAYQVLIR